MSAVSEIFGRNPKRIVTAQREDGTSYFARVEEVQPDFRSNEDLADVTRTGVHRLWANDRLPVELPFLGSSAPLDSGPSADETPEALRTSSPQPGTPSGLRVSLIKMGAREEGSHLHWHDTFDVQWLMAGELWIGLDDGSEQALLPGDAVIQHGTNHNWRTGPEGAVVALFMLGGDRRGIAPPAENKVDWTPEGVARRSAAEG
jgi:hypothetical protein